MKPHERRHVASAMRATGLDPTNPEQFRVYCETYQGKLVIFAANLQRLMQAISEQWKPAVERLTQALNRADEEDA